MQVNLSFDTEKESLDNLKKLVDALSQLISHREGTPYHPMQQQTSSVTPSPVAATVQSAPPQQKPAIDRTSGGCRVVPYEDMSSKMASIFSGRRY